MRKRSIKLIFEKLMWGIIMFIPVIAFALGIGSRKFTFEGVTQEPNPNIGQGTYYIQTNNFDAFMNAWDTDISKLLGQKETAIQSSELYKGLQQIERYILTGTSGSTPKDPGVGDGILIWAVWVIIVEIIHLAVDVILFIPRWAHGVMDTYLAKTGGDD